MDLCVDDNYALHVIVCLSIDTLINTTHKTILMRNLYISNLLLTPLGNYRGAPSRLSEYIMIDMWVEMGKFVL